LCDQVMSKWVHGSPSKILSIDATHHPMNSSEASDACA
jgi:hypothetical protein